MPRGTTKRRPATIAALLDAAWELFAEQGFAATSIPDICARAELTKGAFYSNFADKDALFLALFDRQWRTRADRVRHALPTGRELSRILDGEADLPLAAMEPDRRWVLVSMEFTLHAIRTPPVAVLLAEHEARGRAELTAALTAALDASGHTPAIPAHELVRLLVALAEGCDIQALTEQAATGVAPADLTAKALTTVVRHLSTPHAESAESSRRATPSPAAEPTDPTEEVRP
ncbi:TetR/AcrR family transcriptional regulator [Streptomyces sp. NPDC058469]|uniref:TetR/AcrR family transcriptional regulator n=1 Tax=Streptomyces sp. NPDC058469 TaxID=3346514 RepID=UPI00365A6B8D